MCHHILDAPWLFVKLVSEVRDTPVTQSSSTPESDDDDENDDTDDRMMRLLDNNKVPAVPDTVYDISDKLAAITACPNPDCSDSTHRSKILKGAIRRLITMMHGNSYKGYWEAEIFSGLVRFKNSHGDN